MDQTRNHRSRTARERATSWLARAARAGLAGLAGAAGGAVAAALAVAPAAPARAAVAQADVAAVNGTAAHQYAGGGKGVMVGVLDAGVDVTHPAIRGSEWAQKDFTGQANYDDSKEDEGHGTGVAGIMLGHHKRIYTGLAPSARLMSAKVSTAEDKTSDLWAGNGLLWVARYGSKVANISLGNQIGRNGMPVNVPSAAGPGLTDKFNLMVDYVTERWGMTVVSAGGNDGDSPNGDSARSAVQQAPAGAYNGITVGALTNGPYYDKVWKKSDYSTATDARFKPELVAPGEAVDIAAADWEKNTDYYYGTGTSFAAPMVGGIVAQLVGYGKRHGLSTEPMLMKSILMTSATKVRGPDGRAWVPVSEGPDDDYGYLFDAPLDDRQGAGRADAVAAWRVYAKAKARSTPLTAWTMGSLRENRTTSLALGKFYAGQRVDATLTWYRHVAYRDRNGNGPDPRDTFYQTADLADFVLTLLKDGVPVAASDGDSDNFEHLSWVLEEDGNYSLEVYRFVGTGLTKEAFALSARVVKGAPGSAVAAATGWGYTPVPEPGAAGALAGIAAVALGRRRRRAAA